MSDLEKRIGKRHEGTVEWPELNVLGAAAGACGRRR